MMAARASIVDCLSGPADRTPDRLAFRYLGNGDTVSGEITYGELFARAAGLASELSGAAAPGARAVLLCPPGLDSFVALFACFMAGLAAAPAPTPHAARVALQAPKLATIVEDCQPDLILTTADLLREKGAFAAADWRLAVPAWIAVDQCSARGEAPSRSAAPEDLAILQYTSGSTANPKGVMLTHANLMANQELTAAIIPADENSHLISWLPFHHDMGLGLFLHTIYAGVGCTFMSPMHFMQRPLRWLEAASRFAGTSTAAPNFALAKVADRVAAGGDFSFDLRPLQRIVLGAEPLRARTLSAFAQALAPFGFRAEALVPCYGLAESTVHCTHSPAGAGPQTYGFHADTLRQRQVRPMGAEDRVDVALLVGNGLSGDELHETIIVDPETGQAAQGDAVGEIWFRGPSVGQGYWNRPQDSAQTFEARLKPGGPTWLRTGDLGFLHDGHLFVTGRQKDLIIIRGRNIHPEDVEEVVRRVSPEIGDGATAVESPLEPGVLILAEARGRGFSDPNDVLRRIREAVTAAFEVEVAGIQLLPPLHLPRTTSGKVRRGHALAQWSAGTLRPTAAWPPAAILSAVDG